MFTKMLEWIMKEGLAQQSFHISNGIVYPTKELIINVHNFLIKYFKGDSDEIHQGVVKEANIEHVLNHIKTEVKGSNPEEHIRKKAAYLMHYLFTAHCFTDGNKRTGFVVTLLFLSLNVFLTIKSFPADYKKNVVLFKRWANKKTNDKKAITAIEKWLEKNT